MAYRDDLDALLARLAAVEQRATRVDRIIVREDVDVDALVGELVDGVELP